MSQAYTPSSLQPMLTATAGTPSPAAVSAAPTVPECNTRCPVFGPGLMPEVDELGGRPEPAEAGGVDRGRGRRVDRAHLDAGKRCPGVGVDRDRARLPDRPDRGAAPAAIARGRDDEHLVAGADEGPGQRLDAGRLDAVVVRHQDPHARTPPGFTPGSPERPPLDPRSQGATVTLRLRREAGPEHRGRAGPDSWPHVRTTSNLLAGTVPIELAVLDLEGTTVRPVTREDIEPLPGAGSCTHRAPGRGVSGSA